MRRSPIVGGAVLIALFACGCDRGVTSPDAVPTPTSTSTQTFTALPSPTNTAVPTATTTIAPTASTTPTTTSSSTQAQPPTPTLTATPPPPTSTPTLAITARARRITATSDLIGGPLARGRIGDYLIANDKIRVIIADKGRHQDFLLTYGGNIIDADRVRPAGEPDRDSFEAVAPLINISSTINVQEIDVINDGSDGGAAVVRTVGVDDLFDPIDPVSSILGFGVGGIPESARDKDLPIEIMTTYTLQPGDEYVKVETTVKNNGETKLNLYIGDFVNGSGEFDLLIPGLGFGQVALRPTIPLLAYTGYGLATGVSYGIVPKGTASGFNDSGITAYIAGQRIIDVLLFQALGAFPVEAGATNTYERYFVVGDGDAAAIVDAQNKINRSTVGTVAGKITAGGQPARDALVAVLGPSGPATATLNVVDSLRTDAAGNFSGTLRPGNYRLLAKLPGYPYDSGTTTPTQYPITVVAGGTVTQDIQLPGTGTLRVRVSDQDAQPLAAKVSIVGFDASPDPGTAQNLGGFKLTGNIFGTAIKQRSVTLFGVVDVVFTGLDGGREDVSLQPGEYELVVSHGPEYSIAKQRITILPDARTDADLKLARVVDTDGFVSTDFHVHLINSPDCWVTKEERVLTMLAEGVDYFVATDHDFRTDLRPTVASLGAGGNIGVSIAEEITTADLGHFNSWPLPIDPNSLTGGALDWGRAGVAAGRDFPSLGSYDLSPAEIFAALPAQTVRQVNHVNSATLGFLTVAGIDTLRKPPQSFTPPSLIRQDPNLANLFSDGFTALELWIEGSREQTEELLGPNLGDWFNLLNQGIIRTATSDSDTHHTALIQAGGPRNFVASSSDDPAQIDEMEIVNSVNQGRVIGSNAPFVRISIDGDNGESAGLALGQTNLVRATSGTVTLNVRVQSPVWAEFDTVDVFVNTVPTAMPDKNIFGVEVPSYVPAPQLSLKLGRDFERSEVVVHPDIAGAVRFEAQVTRALQVDRDAWVVVVVRGSDGVSKPLWPMNPQDLQVESNQTLDALTDGNLGEGGQPAVAYTNPLFIDVDGNGRFDPAP